MSVNLRERDYMIKQLIVDNFKSLNNFKIIFSTMNVLVGKNGAGKTTVLQALDLVKNIATKDLTEYIKDRGWSASDIKSQLNDKNKNIMKFDVTFGLVNGDNLIWAFELNPVKKSGKVLFVREKITRQSDNRQLLEFSSKGGKLYNFEQLEVQDVPAINLGSSLLKTIDTKKHKDQYPELVEMKLYFQNSDSYELLSTDKMRKTGKGSSETIGLGGEKIASYINGLSLHDIEKLSQNIKNNLSHISSIRTYKKNSSDTIFMDISEIINGKEIHINSKHISDGTLRIIALAAITMISKDSGFVLLDEIEDGIGTGISASIVSSIEKSAKENGRQIFITTHSSIMLDYFDQNSIIYIWKNTDGQVLNKRLTDSKIIAKLLNDMYPGELLYNLEDEKIVEYLMARDGLDESFD